MTSPGTGASALLCPICRRALPVDAAALDQGRLPPNFPFCSDRCKATDLGRWASGKYVVPGDPVPDEDLPEDAG